MESKKPKLFVTHSSNDKWFAEDLSQSLRRYGFDVWYDAWAISVGDSIVEKVFSGLDRTDVLIVVLSPNSVKSRWVKEELTVAVMRRLSSSDIRIMPVLIEDCEIPTELRHLKYADFRNPHAKPMGRDEPISDLIEALSPGHLLWESMAHHYDHLCLICDHLSSTTLNDESAKHVLKLHELLESALNLRTEIQIRKTRQEKIELDFFQKIGLLADNGIDVRSKTWNAIVSFRAGLAHEVANVAWPLYMFAQRLKERSGSDDPNESLNFGMERTKEIMHTLCFDRGNSVHDSI